MEIADPWSYSKYGNAWRLIPILACLPLIFALTVNALAVSVLMLTLRIKMGCRRHRGAVRSPDFQDQAGGGFFGHFSVSLNNSIWGKKIMRMPRAWVRAQSPISDQNGPPGHR
ncbi:hypothetical protein F9K79_00420 [Ochrobactrum sp. Kaboul]|nr:hypothetical protein F9K79_00420 [Ochrobactrum sp. Kaboul]